METKTDRELLELAAKAGEVDICIWSNCNAGGFLSNSETSIFWNPLLDDGDRYRLAKHLKMLIDFECKLVSVHLHDGSDESLIWERWENDEDEANAILRLAARIGESK